MTPGTTTRRPRLRALGVAAVATAIASTTLALAPQTARADTYAPGVGTETIFSNSTPLTTSTGQQAPGIKGTNSGGQGASEIKFGNRGDMVLSEKSGRLIYFSSTKARQGTVLTDKNGKDLVGDIMTIQDTGLSGMTLDPSWPRKPYIYVLYLSNDKVKGQGEGKWANGECKNDGTCITQGKLDRLTVGTNRATGRPYIADRKNLITDWCQGTRTHSVGDLTFGPDGYLYASAGDGTPEFGGQPVQSQICGGLGNSTKYPSKMLTMDALDKDVAKVTLNGKIIKIDPRTGKAAPGNPWATSSDPNRQRIVGMGFRNPYRMVFQPGTSNLTLSMVGYDTKETVFTMAMRHRNKQVYNAGWPCWEGTHRYEDGPLCSGLSVANGTVVAPAIEWDHHGKATPDETCAASSPQASMGVAYASWWMPRTYRGALFFNDYGRGCTYYKAKDGSLHQLAQFPKHTVRTLMVGPYGKLYFPDYQQGSVRAFTLT